MMSQNESEISNDSHEIENKNNRSIEYKIPFPEPLARGIEKFANRFYTSFEKLFEYLLNKHFFSLHCEIIDDDNELLVFYYFCVDVIFSENNKADCKSPKKSEINIQNITVKITEEHNDAIKKICEVIHYKPEVFISKAIECQWNLIQGDIDAGYYYIIDDFCNVSKIKQALEKIVKQSKANNILPKKKDLNNDGNKSK